MPAVGAADEVALGFHFWSGCLPCEGGGTRLGSGESERKRAEGAYVVAAGRHWDGGGEAEREEEGEETPGGEEGG
jgi:hypothetical protein